MLTKYNSIQISLWHSYPKLPPKFLSRMISFPFLPRGGGWKLTKGPSSYNDLRLERFQEPGPQSTQEFQPQPVSGSGVTWCSFQPQFPHPHSARVEGRPHSFLRPGYPTTPSVLSPAPRELHPFMKWMNTHKSSWRMLQRWGSSFLTKWRALGLRSLLTTSTP